MTVDFHSVVRRTWRAFASVETGVVLLILVVVLSALGSVILQRPVTPPNEMHKAYSPNVLRILDAAGLTDVFHSWWFLSLVFLVSLCILASSFDRLPYRWRCFTRPDKFPDDSFRRTLPAQKSLTPSCCETDEEASLAAAESVLRSMGLRPERIESKGQAGIFAERHRVSELAVYFVHASLLLIFFGTLADGFWGWRGTLILRAGQSSNTVELHDGRTRTLPFSVRCDSAGQEAYQDGTAKRWWSRLTVCRDGRSVVAKEVVVNDPLLYSGIRFYQSRYGPNGDLERLVLSVAPRGEPWREQAVALELGETVTLDADTTVRFAEFYPDFEIRDGRVHHRSNELHNPVSHLVVNSRHDGKSFDVWLPQLNAMADNAKAPWDLHALDLKVGSFTELEVTHEPGQWSVWAGVLLMGVGLFFVFYLVHMRFWVLPIRNAKSGSLKIWIGGSANRNRDAFEARFTQLTALIQENLNPAGDASPTDKLATGKLATINGK